MKTDGWRAGTVLLAAVVALGACADDDATSATVPSALAEPAVVTDDPAGAVDGAAAPAETAPRQPGAITESTTTPESAETAVPSAAEGSPASEVSPAPEGSTAATTPPTTGDITQVVEASPLETLPSTPLADPVEIEGTARMEIVSVERVEAEARLPGEIAGTALAVTVAVDNVGPQAIDLTGVTVNLADAAGIASAPLTAAPNAPLEGELALGQNGTGVYLFDFGADRSEPITVEVSAVVGTPTAVFVGPVN